MTFLSASFAFLVAGPLLVAGSAHAASTHPATQARHPAPLHAVAAPPRKPTSPRPVAVPAAAPVAAAIVAAAPQPAEAPRQLSLSGTVVGTDGHPLAGVSVFPTFNPRLIAVTDDKGFFSLQLPTPDGPFHLQTDYFGLGSSRVEVDAQHPQPINIVLGQ